LKKSPKDIRAPTIDQKQEPNWDQRGRGEQSPPMQSHSEQSTHARGVKGGKYDSKQKDPKIGDPREKAWEEWLTEQKSNTERSIHGNAGREPNSGVNTNTGFDASEDYEGFSHSGLRPEQFKHEKVKPKVTTKERINIGTTNPSKPSAGTGDGGNPYDTKTGNKDVKGRAVAGKDKK